MGKPLVRNWKEHTFGFQLVDCTAGGKVVLTEQNDTLVISAKIGGNTTQLGTLHAHLEQDQSCTVSFLAMGAGPNIRFKYLQTDVTRQVPVALFQMTAFYIICDGNVVKVVMLVLQ